jgi:MYXO-CTERM domain-containing protein
VECGDGVTNEAAGEECDDGSTEDGDGCSSMCEVEQETTSSTGDGSTGDASTSGSETQGVDTGLDDTAGTSGEGTGNQQTSGPDTLPPTSGPDGGTETDTDNDSVGAVPEDDGCNCSTQGTRGGGRAWSFLALLGLGALRRRRRSA